MTAEDKAKNAGKVALVLEGGSFRGQFTAGVLDVLMEAGVEIPAVYGVSAGALNGVNYKSSRSAVPTASTGFVPDNRSWAPHRLRPRAPSWVTILSSTMSRTAWIPLTTKRSTRAPPRCTPSRRTCSLEPLHTCRSKAPCSTSMQCAPRRRCRW